MSVASGSLWGAFWMSRKDGEATPGSFALMQRERESMQAAIAARGTGQLWEGRPTEGTCLGQQYTQYFNLL